MGPGRLGESATTGAAIRPLEARAEYTRRLEACQLVVGRRARLEQSVANGRLIVFASVVILLWAAFWLGRIGWAWSCLPMVVFVALVVIHERVRGALRRSTRAVEHYRKGLQRIDGTWAGSGTTGRRFLDVEHPYAADLDLFGDGSLFERFCTARTRSGEERLAGWFLGPATPSEIRERHEAVAELRPGLDLREDLDLLGSDVREGIDPDALAAWGREPAVFVSRAVALTASTLAALGVVTLIIWIAAGVGSIPSWGRLPLYVIICLEITFSLFQRAKVHRVLALVKQRTHDLVLLSGLLERLERERYASAALVRLHDALETAGAPAFRRVARLARLLELLDAKDNQFFAPFAALVLWTTHVAMAIDSLRVVNGPEIAGWLQAVGEFEALSALAAYSYENPSDPFPEIEEHQTCFEGEAVGHPLIPSATCVRNDVRLGSELRMLLVSGSNMSGKSTLLRTVGVNSVLALAGAPVRANRLRVSPLSIGATLRIQDSLQAGRSRFYAEITRVRRLVELSTGTPPLLFLLDEIFHGTNSHDRVVGARGVVSGLLGRGAIGLVTTHDLALAEVANSLAPRATNVHFEDQLVDGSMRFDYRMRPGIVTHSNALALMRAVGLDV